jgi:predicted phage baseplate assembly protein
MPLPAPDLDGRKFQDIVNEAKRLIPQFCPEWTDHNVSDPGIALVELFAWMTEALLYRSNQISEKTYIKFLEMIGVRLDPPRSARVPVTFYLSGPQPNEVLIPFGTETATLRTETSPAVVFTTEADLIVRPPSLSSAYTHRSSAGQDGWIEHELSRLGMPDESLILFPNPPSAEDAFYLAFEHDLSHHVVAIVAGCKRAGGSGVDPTNPPLAWEVWQNSLVRWVACELELDGTGGFNNDGEIVLRLPAMAEEEFAGLRAYWLRCRIVGDERAPYVVSPELERYFRIESRGGTVEARHAVTVKDEILGTSDGSAGQIFRLANSPVLSRHPESDHVIVETPLGKEDWSEVQDFAEAKPDERCYTLETDGTIAFGPSLPQPDGSHCRFGAVPPKGSVIRFTRYQYGGGVAGNVLARTISVLKVSIPYIASVRNHDHAIGGRDGQTLPDAKLRAARHLRAQARAVTAEDFELHATSLQEVARARCLAPGAQPGEGGSIQPGQVFVLVLPQTDKIDRPSPEEVALSEDVRRGVLDYLGTRCVMGMAFDVRGPDITWISVTADLLVSEHSHAEVIALVQERATNALYQYLNPYIGGPHMNGWPFGRDLHLSEIYGLLQRVTSVEYVESVRIEIMEPGRPLRPAPPRVTIPRHGLIGSGRHTVTVARTRR